MDSVRVHSPATVSNVVCGFDCLGFALSEPYDEVVVRKIPEPTIKITHHDDFGLPTEPEKNVVGVSLRALLDLINADFGFEIEVTKHIKPGSGIGSSSASSCGAVVGANRLIGDRLSKMQLAELAMEGEKLASGARHADNVAPCIFGGFTLVRSVEPLDIISLDFPTLFSTVIHPQIEIRTADARAMLPKDVPLSTAVKQWSNLASLVAALAKGDLSLIARSMEDHIVEPVRRSRIPNFDELKAVSLAAGALGGGISGSGPSVFMLSDSRPMAEDIATAMAAAYSNTGIEFNIHISEISPNGASIIA